MIRVGIPKEILNGETRVAIVPKDVTELKKCGCEALVEMDAGRAAFFANAQYIQNGAMMIPDAEQLFAEADVVLKVQPPQRNQRTGKHEIDMMKSGSIYVGFLAPLLNPDVVRKMVEKNITSFAMEYIPRLARAQSMDALSSMASIAGYRAVLIAAERLSQLFPRMITAAGTIPPARILVVGTGVAGLQAIATAHRLGARVEAFDVRPAAKEEVKSLGAQFIEMELPEDAETASGYAKEMPDEFLKKERETIASRLSEIDVVITTAQVFGKKPPLLIIEAMLKEMREGSVIVDLAAEQGGNCELTKAGKDVVKHGILIHGAVNLPASLPMPASKLYSKNITNLFKVLYKPEDESLDFEDEITRSTCITHNGKIMNEMVEEAFLKEE